jgi:hypothetical protein
VRSGNLLSFLGSLERVLPLPFQASKLIRFSFMASSWHDTASSYLPNSERAIRPYPNSQTHIPNLAFFHPNLTGNGNFPQIEQNPNIQPL